ncbi:tRNA 2-thiouridine(34) synthase MnmA [Marinifilum flexuosum]|uniref:tRNA-specific 2-thiouridylase MnmA n=1 Tax=Marinifilum flexuosum TaxID=1117708 RepID=A0A419X916_9BACT|nr:tRNA 2-thiouridine(34) synthase MnmA [Marinifilum flexuosum]RKE04267.1 tRNA (5-methylaminomethyl-2-thiouridylate)-methyltransferase [Marinifilum flexuosum]
MKKKVVIGLSGGVDSSVAAYLLKEQGYEVEALFMQNWNDTVGLKSEECPFEEDVLFAQMVAKKLDIPFHFVDLSTEYRAQVIDYMFAEYEKGKTPNPDVLCNREIKFDVFLKKALELGADYVATGHYCQKETIVKDGKEVYRLIAGEDNNKDQSYFLCQLSQEQLSKAMFPIGHIEKPEVREIARREKLASAEKKDSQGICFVGKVDLPVFLQQKLKAKKGRIIEISADKAKEIIPQSEDLRDIAQPYQFSPEMGEEVGTHNGAHFFTVGQRKGLNVGGKAEPLFVIGTDVKENIVYVGMGHEHPLLMRKALFIPNEDIHFIREDLRPTENCERRYDIRIRYRQPLQGGSIHFKEEGLYIHFDEPQRAVVSGQFAAWYDEGELIGSGVID